MEYKIKIQMSIEYIEDNLCEKIKLGDLAKEAFISNFHYHRLFHNIVGETLMGYVRKRRMAEAAKDLIETREKIMDIALKYQFGSQESFDRAFKKMYGVTPREVRKGKLEIISYKRVNVIDENSGMVISTGTIKCMAA